MDYKKAREICKEHGATLKVCKPNHWQINGEQLVNYYPVQGTAYVNSSGKTHRKVDLYFAIELSLETPEDKKYLADIKTKEANDNLLVQLDKMITAFDKESGGIDEVVVMRNALSLMMDAYESYYENNRQDKQYSSMPDGYYWINSKKLPNQKHHIVNLYHDDDKGRCIAFNSNDGGSVIPLSELSPDVVLTPVPQPETSHVE